MFMALRRKPLSISMFICPCASQSCQKYAFPISLTEFTQTHNNLVISEHVTELPSSGLPPWIPTSSSERLILDSLLDRFVCEPSGRLAFNL